jgi:c-di-GMP-binding flagellar brake protein YcgR
MNNHIRGRGLAAMRRGNNRRKYPRVDVEIQATVADTEEALNYRTQTRDVSAGGLCVVLETFLEAPTPVSIVLELPDGQPPLETVGRVAWCVREKKLIGRKHPTFDTGISFTDLSTQQRERLIRFAHSFIC